MGSPGRIPGSIARTLEIALATLRASWRGAVLLVVLGASGLGVLVAVRSLATPDRASTPRLDLARAASAGTAYSRTIELQEPAALQAHALADLYQLLLILGWAALAIAGISMLSRLSADADIRGPEIGVRRAVGASKRAILMELLFEAGILLVAM